MLLKNVEKEVEEQMKRNCFVCEQPMFCIGNMTWYCENCELLYPVQNLIALKDKV